MLRTRAPTHTTALEGSVIFGNVFKIYDRPADVARVLLYDVQTQGEAGMPGLGPERDPDKKGDDEKKKNEEEQQEREREEQRRKQQEQEEQQQEERKRRLEEEHRLEEERRRQEERRREQDVFARRAVVSNRKCAAEDMFDALVMATDDEGEPFLLGDLEITSSTTCVQASQVLASKKIVDNFLVTHQLHSNPNNGKQLELALCPSRV
jgi:flagellar biosynthesis GTPase FlhF